MSKLFIALNFSADGLLSRKVSGFRKRFDPKYQQYSFNHMSMLAPFSVDEFHVKVLGETLKEEIETFFYGKTDMLKLAFAGVGVYKHNKKNILYLNPIFCSDLQYCSEMVLDVAMSYISPSARYKKNKAQFLPLGYFSNENELQAVLEQSKIEFEQCSELTVESISLYQSYKGSWIEKEILINFGDTQSNFLQLNA